MLQRGTKICQKMVLYFISYLKGTDKHVEIVEIVLKITCINGTHDEIIKKIM